MLPPPSGSVGSITGLSVTDGCRWQDSNGTSMRFRVLELLVNIAHFRKDATG
jgi:hypothetical protein